MPPVSSYSLIPNVIKPKSSASQSLTWGVVPFGDPLLSQYSFIIGVNDVGYGATASTGYWNGVTPASGGWTIYRNIGNGTSIDIRKANSNTQIISIANEYGAGVNSVYDAISYLILNNYLVVNYNLPNFQTYGLVAAFLSGWTPCFDASFNDEQAGVFALSDQIMDQFFQMQNGNATLDLQNGIVFESSKFLSLANTNNIPTGNNNYGICVWFKTTSLNQTLVAWGDQNTDGQYVRLDIVSNGGVGVLQLDCGSTAKVTSTDIVNDGFWHCAAVTFNGSTGIIWLDGVQVKTGTIGTLNISNQFTSVGAYYTGATWTNYFTGSMKFVAINAVIYDSNDALAFYDNFLGIIDSSNATPILSLDAGTYTSGTTWTDSVGGKIFNLYNSPTHSTSNGGYFTFLPSSSQYAMANTSLPSMTNWTVEVWHYYTGNNTGLSPCIVTEHWPNTTGNINYSLGSVNDNNPNLQSAFFDGAWENTPNGYTLSANNWYYIVGTYNGTTLKLYVNNVLVESQTYTGTPSSALNGIVLMRRWDDPPGGFWGGRLAIVNIYDIAIGASKISQNWHDNKSRFGL